MEPCDVGPGDEQMHSAWFQRAMDEFIARHYQQFNAMGEGEGRIVSAQSPDDPSGATPLHSTKRHHPNGIEPPELYEQWRAQERAKERDLTASCPDVKSYTQACRYMHAEPPSPQLEPYQAEGAVFARLIGNE